MLRGGVLASVLLAFAAAGAPAAEHVADPTREFVDGYDPSQNDFFANTPERTVLLRIRDDLDGDGVADLALSESSTWGNAGGQWLLFRGEPGGRYVYWGTLFFSPGSAAIGPRPGELTAYVRVGATRGSLRVHRLAAGGITLAGDRSLDLENPPIGQLTTPRSGPGGGPRSSTAGSSRTGVTRGAAGSPGWAARPRYTCRP